MIDVLSEFNKWKETYTEINKSIDPLEELYLNDIISEDIFEKARSGTYSDTPQNKKLGRVGENIPDWDWPNGGIDEFLDSLKTKKVSKIEKSNKHEKWL